MKRIIVTLQLILGCAVVLSPVFGGDDISKSGQAGFKSLDIPVGARATALGRTGLAIDQGALAIFNNAAGTAYVEGMQFAFAYQPWIADIAQTAVAGAMSVGNLGVFSVSLLSVDYGDLEGTRRGFGDDPYESTGTFTPSALAVGVGFARQMTDKFAWGMHLRFASEDYGSGVVGNDLTDPDVGYSTKDFKESAVTLDFGTLFYTGYKDLRLAMSLQNFSGERKIEEEFFSTPISFKVGLAMDVLQLIGDGGGNSLTIEADLVAPRDYSLRTNLGAEFWFKDMIALRGGMIGNHDEAGITAGFGVHQGLGPINLRIDYAFTSFGIFGAINSFDLSLEL